MPSTELKGPAYFVESYRESPIENLILLKGLWNMQKGSLRDGGQTDVLFSMTCALSLGFRDLCGYTIDEEGGESQPAATVEGPLWEACIMAGLPPLLLEMIQDDTFAEQPYDWILAVLVLNAGVARIWESRAHPRASGTDAQKSGWKAVPDSLAERYFQQKLLSELVPFRVMWDTLWSKRDALLSDKNTSKPGIAAALIVFAHSLVLLHVNVYPERIGHVLHMPGIVWMSLAAWTSVAASSRPEAQLHPDLHCLPFQIIKHSNDRCVEVQASLPDSKKLEPAVIWRFTIDKAIDGIGRLRFMQACYTALATWPFMTGLNLQACLQGLTISLCMNEEGEGTPLPQASFTASFRRAYWDAPMLDAISAALLRESERVGFASASDFNTEVHAGIVIACSELIHFTLDGLEESRHSPPVANGVSIYTMISICLHILRNVVKDQTDESQSDIMFAKILLTSVFERLAELCDGRQMSKTPLQTSVWHRIVLDMSAAAQNLWKVDTESLIKSKPDWKTYAPGGQSFDVFVERWGAFGKALNAYASRLDADKLNDSDLKEKRKHLCSCVGCPYHAQPCPTKLSVCAGCGEQQYCSRDCQKKDWKLGGHRIKCRRLKA